MPLKWMNQGVTVRIGSNLGSLKSIDNNLEKIGWGSFMRTRVEINIKRLLRRCISLMNKGREDVIMGRLKYKRLPLFCHNCGLLGHSDMDCESVSNNRKSTNVKKQYGH